MSLPRLTPLKENRLSLHVYKWLAVHWLPPQCVGYYLWLLEVEIRESTLFRWFLVFAVGLVIVIGQNEPSMLTPCPCVFWLSMI